MNRFLLACAMACIVLLNAGCSDRNRSDPNAEEWAEIEAMAGGEESGSRPGLPDLSASSESVDPEINEEFALLAEQLQQMKTIQRRNGQTLMTGDRLVFDYMKRIVRMDGDVLVDDDHGQLRTESLVGRFSDSNQVESVEATGDVLIDASGRQARADQAVYNYRDGTVEMTGQASLSEEGNSLSGERIRFWLDGDPRMICEPNALLMVSRQSETSIEGLPDEVGETEIRANRIVFDDGKHRADLTGNVRFRNAQLAMNCNAIHLYLKDDNKIDWIEAVGDVIIQSDGREALADTARYDAEEGKFTLEGQPPMVKMGRNVMTGDRITFWHKTRAVLCEPNGRVLYYYDLDEETQAKFPKDLND